MKSFERKERLTTKTKSTATIQVMPWCNFFVLTKICLDSGGCGLTKELYDDMRNFQRSFIDDDSYSYSSAYNSSLYEANFKTRSHLAQVDDDIFK